MIDRLLNEKWFKILLYIVMARLILGTFTAIYMVFFPQDYKTKKQGFFNRTLNFILGK